MPRLLLIIVLFCLRVSADDIGLVRVGEFWRYFKGVTEPSPVPGDWKEPAFVDSSWTQAPGSFSSLGVHGLETTVLADFGTAYSTVYFRKKFQVANPEVISWLVLRVDYDDGFVAYINGTEVARRGVAGAPGELVPFNGTAAKHLRNAVEEIDLSAFKDLLKEGENLLAIQTLNSGAGDFTMCMSTELLGNFTRGPLVQNASTESIQVIWKTPLVADGAVEFGVDTNNLQTTLAPGLGTNHVVSLTNLAPNTEYYYRIRSSTESTTAYGPFEKFKTLKTEGPVTFTVIGDTGSGSYTQHVLAGAMRNHKVDLVVQVGDIVYPSMMTWLVDPRCFSVYHQQMRTTPFFYAHGNHDSYSSRTILMETFYLPTNNVTGTEHFYSFDHGDVHFVILNSDLQAGMRYDPLSDQYRWLEADLQQTQKKWKFLFFHHTIRTSSIHLRDDYDLNGVLDTVQLESSIGELASRYGVQIIFTGHDHVYERLAPDKGYSVFVSGGGGAGLYGLSALHRTSAQFMPAYNFLKVTVSGDTTHIQALDWNKMLDQVHIHLKLPEKRTYQAAWGTPQIESKPADDGDGNVINQRFDFLGEPIPGKTGDFSAPGRLYVNNDKQFLYLGLDEVMLQPDQNLFLFVETPRSSGVDTMRNIGNDLLDAEAEGADALDFLHNLSFTNFNPSVGCILGDEFADYLFRSYVRTGMNQNIGQGAFKLEAGLPEVFGTRLQQFNRSPQTTPWAGEQNADFIELALPLSSLDLQAGETIKVAVLVGKGPLDPATRVREIDNGGIGAQLLQARGFTQVEGIEVKLAPDPDPDGDGLLSDFETSIGTDPEKADSDGDGLPDGWEYTHGLNPLLASGADGANGDPDEDGLTNLQEFVNRTNPNEGDTDGDSLPDLWEVQTALDPTKVTGIDGAAGDPDEDRYTNLQEYLAGTDPWDNSSVLRLELVPSANQARLNWPTVQGRSYQLQYAGEVTQPFSDIADPTLPRAGSGNIETFLHDLPAEVPGGLRLYRVKVLPQP